MSMLPIAISMKSWLFLRTRLSGEDKVAARLSWKVEGSRSKPEVGENWCLINHQLSSIWSNQTLSRSVFIKLLLSLSLFHQTLIKFDQWAASSVSVFINLNFWHYIVSKHTKICFSHVENFFFPSNNLWILAWQNSFPWYRKANVFWWKKQLILWKVLRKCNGLWHGKALIGTYATFGRKNRKRKDYDCLHRRKKKWKEKCVDLYYQPSRNNPPHPGSGQPLI